MWAWPVKMTVNNVSDGHKLFDSSANKPTVADRGGSLDTASVFDVPAGTVPESIELHDSFGSAGVVVGLSATGSDTF